MKKILSILIFVLSFFTFNINSFALEIEIKSKNAILYNITDDKVLYEKNADEEVYIASLTKMMTAIVAIENIKDFNEKVLVTGDMLKNVTYDLSVAGFNIGDVLTYNEILYGIILESGADATEIIAYSLSGSEEEFVKLMNVKAKEIGMNNSYFSNVIGIEGDNHHSTARDMMKLVKYAIKNEKFKEVFCTKTYQNMNGPLKRITNSDTYNMEYVKGAKTGFTDDAGLCLATYAYNGKTEFILVTIGAPYKERNENIVDTKNIYEYFFDNYDYIGILNKGDQILNIKDVYGKEYNIKSDKNIKLYLNKFIDKSDLKYEYKGKKILEKNIKKGDKIGTLYIYHDDDNIYTLNVISPETIKFDFKFFVKNHKLQFVLLTLIITAFIVFINIKRIKIKK